jgi:hypothetical protein
VLCRVFFSSFRFWCCRTLVVKGKRGGGGDCFKKLTLEYKCEIIRTYILVHKT